MNKSHVVIWDPSMEGEDPATSVGGLPTGTLADGKLAEKIRQCGGVCLPVVAEHAELGHGYVVRHWGQGVTLNHAYPRFCCPFAILAPEGFRGLHWAIRLSGTEVPNSGLLRVAADTTQPYTQRSVATPLEGPITGTMLGAPDDEGGWTLRGRATLSVPVPGYVGLGIYGSMPGTRVAWVAASLIASH